MPLQYFYCRLCIWPFRCHKFVPDQFEAGLLSWKRQQEKLQDEMKAVSDNIRAVADNLREAENRVKTQIANGGGGGSAFGSGGSSGGR